MYAHNTIRTNQLAFPRTVSALFLAAALGTVAAAVLLPEAVRGIQSLSSSLQAHVSGPLPNTHAGVVPTIPALDASAGAGASYNWSGYAALGRFTGVYGTWTTPTVIPGVEPIASDATWVGIGGVVSSDLIQAGTQALVEDGTVTYRAWYELLPDPMTYVPLRVRPGDSVEVSVTESTPDRWEIVISNTTTGKSYKKTVAYESSKSSAEWIEERPSLASGGLLPLADFGSVRFWDAGAVTDGVRKSASEVGAEPIVMISRGGATLAQPSALAGDGAVFTVARAEEAPVALPQEFDEPAEHVRRAVVPGIRIILPGPLSPLAPDMARQPHSVTSSSHGSYEVWVNGKLVEKKEW